MKFRIYGDWIITLCILMLTIFGLFFLYSASDGNTDTVIKQLAFIILGFILFFLIAQLDPENFRRLAYFSLAASFLLMLITALFGPESLPLTMATFLQFKKLPISMKDTFFCLFIIGISALTVVIQPDLGTSLLVALSGLFVLFLAGLSWSFIGVTCGLLIIASPFIWNNLLRPFQKERILTLFNPESDPFGSGWNIIQSRIAIGSGGISGKGYGEGSQTHFNFLPETETDFIFAVAAEEFGFIGVLIILSLFLILSLRTLYFALNARDRFCRLVVGGLLLTFLFNLLVNISMVIGLIPVVGMPLPFLSKGGSSMITLFILFGIIMSIGTHKTLMQR
ncbi:MAG: rod shape-determining protein RodA [Proteobacteria bacterium]|nr:rod shape-determining protein RodA [Pseudomonadota bacterium]